MKHLLITLLVALFMLQGMETSDLVRVRRDLHDHEVMETGAFKACTNKCKEQFHQCVRKEEYRLLEFKKHKDFIRDYIKECCLGGEADLTAPSTLSFATCMRDNCKAKLWGFDRIVLGGKKK
ncbi:hypothetical protein Ciccas_007199 [Cichlidogyrus casuarinus]|uniref:Uncharacterized protein n=1 Tax=Cichlidogyrus casuarinus TaxID=1844966 RepID=A0ABD2Q3V8_9PLAT